MATLVLTAVGSAIGGPIGGAIGAAFGQQVDSAIFAPKPREGNRLKELAVQTSSYGTQIPQIFGAMRVAGTVIWSTDLIEQRVKSGGGKGRPSTINFSYRVSLAIALSSRPVGRIGRIWADGNLIRGVAGDLKIDTQMRFYNGHENQRPDPLLASAEAIGECPAHRDVAYAVFEDLQLAEFGNRIPSFTFEIFEREGPVPLSSLFEAASNGEIQAESLIDLDGFAAAGPNVKMAVSPILEICPLELVVRNDSLVVRDLAVLLNAPYPLEIVAEENGRALDRPKHVMPRATNVPSAISLRYYDTERDYQAGIQQIGVERGGRGEMRLEFPAVLSAMTAKSLVDAKDSQVRYARDIWSACVAASETAYQPGDLILTPNGRVWKIFETEMGLATVNIKARATGKYGAARSISASPGRHVASADQPIGETRINIVELPWISGGDPVRPSLALFAAGTEAGWKRAAITMKIDEDWTELGSSAPAATMGLTRTPLASHQAYLVDEGNALEIELLNSSMTLALRNTSPLASDAPLFWIDGEFVRVGCIISLGDQSYRLSRLSRACFSGAMQSPAHPPDAKIVLLNSNTALMLPETTMSVGETVQLEAHGFGDSAPASAITTVDGLAIKPLPPVHGRAIRNLDGSVDLDWKRRSRLDLGWVNGVDQAQVEGPESYRVALHADAVILKEWTVAAPALHIPETEMAALAGLPDTRAQFSVRQIGSFAQSDPVFFHAR